MQGESGAAALAVDIEHRQGAFTLQAAFSAPAGVTALFGRSGSGKTTLVNILAGLVRPQRGRVAVGSSTLVDTGAGRFVPAHRRRVGYVFQDGRLLPHLTVRQNLLYGRWFAGRTARNAARLDDAVELLGLGHLLGRRPGTLSGGETQRVAIGRALLSDPRLLLMDEPLASLDAARKAEILPYLERLRDHARVPIVYVSHAVAEVARLADTLVLLADGRVEAVGPAAGVLGRIDLYPMTGRFEAGSVLTARVSSHERDFGLTVLDTAAGPLRVPALDLDPGAAVRLRVRARDVLIALRPPEGLSALNVLPARVAAIGAADGAAVEVALALGHPPPDSAPDPAKTLRARLTRRSVAELGLAPGLPVYAVIKSVALDRPGLAMVEDERALDA